MHRYESPRIEVDIRKPNETLHNSTQFKVIIKPRYDGQHTIKISGAWAKLSGPAWVIKLRYSSVLKDASSVFMKCKGMELSTLYTHQGIYTHANARPIESEWIFYNNYHIIESRSFNTCAYMKYTDEWVRFERRFMLDDLDGYVIQRKNGRLTLKRISVIIPQNHDLFFNFIIPSNDSMDLVC